MFGCRLGSCCRAYYANPAHGIEQAWCKANGVSNNLTNLNIELYVKYICKEETLGHGATKRKTSFKTCAGRTGRSARPQAPAAGTRTLHRPGGMTANRIGSAERWSTTLRLLQP